jgi:hypothetical protein
MTALPELERELRAAAARRVKRRRHRARRTGLAVALVGAVAATTAAANGWLTLERGTTSRGDYEIRTAAPEPREADEPDVAALRGDHGQVCLELRFQGLRPSYGCGERPTERQAIGVVVVDQNAEPGQRLVYGLASPAAAEIRIGATPVTPSEREGVPGRFFSALVPARGPIYIAALNDAGQPIDEIGSQTRQAGKPHSLDEAQAMGDPAGFAPTVRPASAVVYRGREITDDAARAQGLVCVDDATLILHCYDTIAEADAAHRAQTDP